MKTLTPISVKCVWVGDEQDTQFGPERSILCVKPEYAGASKEDTPKDAKFFVNFKPPEYSEIPARGSEFEIVSAGKNKWRILAAESASNGTQSPASDQPQQARQAAQRPSLDDLGAVYRECARLSISIWSEVALETGKIEPEIMQSTAATLFIQASRMGIHSIEKPGQYTRRTLG